MTIIEPAAVEYPQLVARNQNEPHIGAYSVAVRPEFLTDHIALVWPYSLWKSAGSSPTPPVVWDTEDLDEDGPVPYGFAFGDDAEDRPTGAPLLVTRPLPYLEPRYGDAWVAFIYPIPEVA